MCRGVVPPTSRCQPNPVFDLHSSFSRAGGPLALLLADKEQETIEMPSGCSDEEGNALAAIRQLVDLPISLHI